MVESLTGRTVAPHVERSASDPARLSERERLELVRRYGRETTSFQALEEGIEWWRAARQEHAAVAYADTGAAWVAVGAPFSPPERAPGVAQSFVDAARAAGRRACFCAVEQDFEPGEALRALPIGAQPIWFPARWAETLRAHRSLREQLRRARAKKVRARAVAPSELAEGRPMRAAVEALRDSWLASKRLPTMRFLLDVQPFTALGERLVLVAEQQERVVAALIVVPIYARGGWFFEDILRAPSAPNGTVETLIDAGMRRASDEGATLVTMGMVPLAGELPGWMRALARVGRRLYDARGLESFRARLRPDRWEPVRVAFPRRQSALATLWDVLRAVAGQSPITFAFAGLARALQQRRERRQATHAR